MSADLAELEQRVGEKWAAAAAARIGPEWSADAFLPENWCDPAELPSLPPDIPQFPREQWASYPAKRGAVLLLIEHKLDAGAMTDDDWVTICMLMQYGGKTRIA